MGSTQEDLKRQEHQYNYPIWLKVWYSTARWLFFKADQFYRAAGSEKTLFENAQFGTTGPYKFFRGKTKACEHQWPEASKSQNVPNIPSGNSIPVPQKCIKCGVFK